MKSPTVGMIRIAAPSNMKRSFLSRTVSWMDLTCQREHLHGDAIEFVKAPPHPSLGQAFVDVAN